MKQTAVEWLLDCLIEKHSNGSFVWNTRADLEALFEQAKEMEKQQQGYSEEEVELITHEMVNWALDNIGNPNPQSGKKFDEVLNKYKK